MKYTTNAQLKLPDYTDPVDVADINENFTIIDSHLGLFITADGGVHGLRYANGGLEYFNGETWVSAAEVVGAVSEHNSNDTAHSDIRTAVSALTIRLNTLADCDDETLDQISEIVAYIKANRGLVESVTTAKVSKTGDTMTGALTLSGDPTEALHAATKQYVDNLISETNAILKTTQSVLVETTIGTWAETMTFEHEAITATSPVELLPGVGITSEQLEALQSANMVDDGTQATGSVGFKLMGKIPTIAIPVRFIIRRDL